MCSAHRFIFMQIKLNFIWNVYTETRFETEAQGNRPICQACLADTVATDRKRAGAFGLLSKTKREDLGGEYMLIN